MRLIPASTDSDSLSLKIQQFISNQRTTLLHQVVNLIQKKAVQTNKTIRRTKTLDPNNTKKIPRMKRMNKTKMNPLTNIWIKNKLKKNPKKATISQLKPTLLLLLKGLVNPTNY